jgi:rhodanese-related sulfurtransferase
MDYEITPEEVKTKLDAKEAFMLLHVREPWEFETARIDGATLMSICLRGRIRNSIPGIRSS